MGNILDYIILKDGLPIYTKNADPKKGITGDQVRFTMLSGFLSAISSFVDSMNKLGQVDEMQMSSEISFFFQRTVMEASEMLFIVVTNSSIQKQQARWVLETATTKFLDQYLDVLAEFNGNITQFQSFDQQIDRILHEASAMVFDPQEEQQLKIPAGFGNLTSSITTTNLAKAIRPRLRGYTRFNRYRILKGFQNQLRSVDFPDSKMIVADEEVPWASQDCWSSIGDTDCNESASKSDGEFPDDFQAMDNQGALSQTNLRSSLSAVLRGSKERLSGNKFFVISDYEKIPWRQYLPDPFMNKILTTPWKKAVFNAINGQTSVRELAGLFGVNPVEILNICQELATYGAIIFKE